MYLQMELHIIMLTISQGGMKLSYKRSSMNVQMKVRLPRQMLVSKLY